MGKKESLRSQITRITERAVQEISAMFPQNVSSINVSVIGRHGRHYEIVVSVDVKKDGNIYSYSGDRARLQNNLCIEDLEAFIYERIMKSVIKAISFHNGFRVSEDRNEIVTIYSAEANFGITLDVEYESGKWLIRGRVFKFTQFSVFDLFDQLNSLHALTSV